MIHRRVGALELISASPTGAAPAGPPLLFVHGAFCGAWIWAEHFLPWFAARGYAVHAVSLRGHGESDGHAQLDQLGIDDFVSDLETVVADLGSMPVLVGHSMGGFVAQKYLERHPLAALVLMASVPPQGLAAAQMSLLFRQPGLMSELNRLIGGAHVAPEALRQALFAQEIAPETLTRYYRRMQSESVRAMWDMSFFNLPQRWRMKDAPTLVMGAGADALIPEFLVRQTAEHYAAPLTIFSALGHGLMLERDWEEVARSLCDWLIATRVLPAQENPLPA
ncbi:alpha/beta fold hydrolase [Rhodocyclus tenuis]|uniref:Alpha/beta fold hydrolase n=1 Tax=Rhodocyclus tenuis TaxID=1066 RepID=A0A6L5JWT5_RHOTE|nr:alpha/beta fold hydrolase [Rhodocyclus gracilis]MRD73488.1 alpha/beta fold hydrolase [Rhodocyclus gracilis]